MERLKRVTGRYERYATADDLAQLSAAVAALTETVRLQGARINGLLQGVEAFGGALSAWGSSLDLQGERIDRIEAHHRHEQKRVVTAWKRRRAATTAQGEVQR